MDPWKQNSAVNFASMFKYLQSGIKKVNADLKPFAETEAHFVDAKFYVEDDIPSEVVPVEIPSMESKQVEKKHVKFITRKDISSPKEGPKYRNDHFSESTSNSVKAKISTSSNSPPFLRYVPYHIARMDNHHSWNAFNLQKTWEGLLQSSRWRM